MCRRWKKARWKGDIWQGAEEGLGQLGGDEQEPCHLQGWHQLGVLPALGVGCQKTTPVIPCMKPCAELAGNFPLGQFFYKKSMLTKLPTGSCMFSLKMERYTVSRVTAIPLKLFCWFMALAGGVVGLRSKFLDFGSGCVHLYCLVSFASGTRLKGQKWVLWQLQNGKVSPCAGCI